MNSWGESWATASVVDRKEGRVVGWGLGGGGGEGGGRDGTWRVRGEQGKGGKERGGLCLCGK